MPVDEPPTPMRRAPSGRSRWIAMATTGLLALAVLGTLYATTSRLGRAHSRQLEVQRLCGEIKHLDEVLTMSAWLAAATGDTVWQRRYEQHVDVLTAAISSLRNVAPQVFDRELGAETEAANERLVAAERAAFACVAAGDLAAAMALLGSDDYADDKARYAFGNRRVQATLLTVVTDEAIAVADAASWMVLSTTMLAALAAYAWSRVLRQQASLREDARLAQLRAESAAAAAESRAKSALVANVSHELRTPLISILGYAELLTDPDYPADEYLHAATTIQRQGEHLLQLVNDLLDAARADAGRVSISNETVAVRNVVEEVVALLQLRAAEKGITLTTTFEARAPRLVHTDPGRLRQILVNLAGNAVKFTERGGVRIVVDAGASESPTLSIAVHDTGIGLDAEQQARVFRPFEQADASTQRRFGGTGLGLSISRRYAELLGGDITVVSAPGVGSTFTLTLPVLERPPELESTPATTPPGASDPARLRGKRILLADDARDSRRLLGYVLTQSGAAVTAVGDGDEALTAIARHGPFDLVLMDMQMPTLDGYETTRALRARGDRQPIVALTANTLASDHERALAAGCDDVVTKPVARATLLERCEYWTTATVGAHRKG